MSALKEQIRRDIRRLRKEMEDKVKAQMDAQIRERLLTLPWICRAETVYLYASIRSEADTWQLAGELWKREVRTAFPRVEGKQIRFYYVRGREDLTPGAMRIPEPLERCEPAFAQNAPVITPGLAFSLKGDRIGYGGGYYDRFFAKEPHHLRIGTAYGYQIRNDAEADKFDQKMDCLVTPDDIFIMGRMRDRKN